MNLLFPFRFPMKKKLKLQYDDPQVYLYEPNASILKAGAFKSICARFGVYKLHPNTHIYTSHHLVPNFPGRSFSSRGFRKIKRKGIAKSLRRFKGKYSYPKLSVEC